MDNEQEKGKVFDHQIAGVSDKIRLISELEHIRNHALRSAVSSSELEDEVFYLVLASQARDLRRKFMEKHFQDIDTKLWCLCKSTATLRQIAYEIWDEDADMLKELDQLVDDVWGKAVGKDLSGCEVCREDKNSI